MYDVMYTIVEDNANSPVFEWDQEKELQNIKKHNVSFTSAALSYMDGNAIEYYDKNHSEFEERWILIGKTDIDLLTVAYTFREDAIRIISARRATGKEEKLYYGYNKSKIFRT
ncbi:MAG: BrnT family toxin [Erysipelotrichaceae bacterium]|nr:BrnT family toxin [Erysipelotrichaceae bacterium]